VREVSNASNTNLSRRTHILALGEPGTGKSTQFNTLPGRKFAYIFDPNGAAALAGDIDYIEFIPDHTEIDIAAKTLKAPDKQVTIDKMKKEPVPTTYVEWERDYNERRQAKFFDDYDWIMLDSLTTYSEVLMDRIQYLAGRLGKHPEQADWTSEMNLMRQNIRGLSSLAHLYCTAHLEMDKDDLSGKIYWKPVITGRNRIRIPLRFAECLGFTSSSDKEKNPMYEIKIVRDRDHPMVRSTLPQRGHKSPINVTLDFTKPLIGQGLGGILSESRS